MKRCLLVCWLLLMGLVAVPALAQTSGTVTVTYAAGWNMAGGPPGTDLSPAVSLNAFQSGGYSMPASARTETCVGYWAYFNSVTRVTLAPSLPGPTQSCPVQAGWNLVGNPFDSPAALPSVTAYWWDPTVGRYVSVNAIPTGGAAWIYSPVAGSITLSASTTPATPQPPISLTLTDASGAGPYQVHVGNLIELLLPSAESQVATTNPLLLQLQGAGVTGDMSCVGDPGCQIGFLNRFWIWKAIRPGTAYISVAPACSQAQPPCAAPARQIQIDILP